MEVVYHLAAAVGVGQSMYQIADYTATNTLAPRTFCRRWWTGGRWLDRLVVASSMSIYGEGRYRRPDGSGADRRRRSVEQLRTSTSGSLRDPTAPC
jgi:dTDP-L-rhamnose 4-epimerase